MPKRRVGVIGWIVAGAVLSAPMAPSDRVELRSESSTCELPPTDCTNPPTGFVWTGVSRCDVETMGTSWVTCEYIAR